MSYYYLVASLPLLERGDPPPMTADEYLFQCTGPLGTEDWMELQRVIQGDAENCTSAFGQKWFGVDTQLRNAAARVRATRLGVDAGEFVKPHGGWDQRVEHAVTEAFARSTPLERENVLDACRWEVLDEMATAEPFGFGAVLAFAVKLQITRRWHDMKEEEGRRRVEEIIDNSVGDDAWNEFFTVDEDDKGALK